MLRFFFVRLSDNKHRLLRLYIKYMVLIIIIIIIIIIESVVPLGT